MPIGYIVTLVIIGIFTVFGLVRIRRFGHVLFVVALPATELPHLGLLFLGLSTLLAWNQGDLAGSTGSVLMVLCGLILIGLLELLRRALLARRVMNTVMGEHGRHASRRWAWWVRPLLFPFPWRPRSVKRTGPIFYGDHSRQRLDVYRSRDVQAPGPVLVYFHGGGYFTGSNRHEARTLLYHLVSNGWTCISATYRLRPRFGFPEHLADARAALAWAHANGAHHGGDTNRVVMAGSSAGGHLTVLCALPQYEPGNPRVDAAVSLYAYYGRYYGRDEHESPVSTALALDASQAPPFFITQAIMTLLCRSKMPVDYVTTWYKVHIRRSGTQSCPEHSMLSMSTPHGGPWRSSTESTAFSTKRNRRVRSSEPGQVPVTDCRCLQRWAGERR